MFMTSESTHAEMPAGNRSYMTPVANLTAHCEYSPPWCALQLSAVVTAPSAARPSFKLFILVHEGEGG